MMNQILAYGFGIPSIFVLISLAVYRIFLVLNRPLADPLTEMTAGWVSFLRNGIPVPSDYSELGYGRFIGEAFLARPEYHVNANVIALGKR